MCPILLYLCLATCFFPEIISKEWFKNFKWKFDVFMLLYINGLEIYMELIKKKFTFNVFQNCEVFMLVN
jgi:hypothetical protein